MKDNDNKSTLATIIKIIGLITIFSGIYGVSYQKGIIIGMGIGNLNGNYDIREIFNSAILGYIDFLDRAMKINILDILISNWRIILLFTIIGILIPIFYNFRGNIKKYSVVTKSKIKSTSIFIISSYWLSPVISTIVGAAVNLISVLLTFLVFLVLGVLILPALLGYLSGGAKVNSVKGSLVCSNLTEEALKNEYIRQCTQVIIKGSKIMGEVLLENSEGYFMHLNKSFLYISKNKEVCIYSKYEKRDAIKDRKDFQFAETGIEEICIINKLKVMVKEG